MGFILDETRFSSRSPAAFAIGHAMRLPFVDPTREEVVAVATELIMRFGLQAEDEALHLTEVAANMRAVRNCQVYRLAAREIANSFAEARTRMSRAPASEVAG
jgi:hypothetical protein